MADSDVLEDDYLTLPVGLDIDGTRYRQVSIDEMSGVDEEIVGNKKKTGGNGSKALSRVLARCIQSIEGLVERKRNPDVLIDLKYTRNMYQVDRDFLTTRIFMLAGNDDALLVGACPRCGEQSEEEIIFTDLPVIEWPEGQAAQIEFELPRGYQQRKSATKGKKKSDEPVFHKKGILRFPNGIDQENIALMAAENTGRANTALLASCIQKLGDLDNVDQDIVKHLKSADRRYLQDQIRKELPGLRQWREQACWSCGKDMVLTLDMTSFFDGARNSN